MKYLNSLLLAAGFILMNSTVLHSQKQLSLEEAINISVNNSKQLETALYDVNKADADVDEAYGYAMPKIDLTASYTRYLEPMKFYISGDLFPPGFGAGGEGGGGQFIEASSDNAIDARIDVSQTIFNSAVFRSISASDNYSNAARARLKVEVDDIVLNVKNAYYQALLQKESYELIKSSKENAQTNYDNISVLFEQGLVSEYDKIRAEVEVENYKPRLVSAENDFQNAKNNLKLVMGTDPNEKVELTESLESFKEDYENNLSLSEIEQEVLETNPQIKALKIQQEVNKDFIAVHSAEYLPTLDAFGNYQLIGQSNDFNFPTANTSTVGLRLKMNIFSGFRTDAKVEKAELDLKKTKTQEDMTKLNLKSQVRDLINRIRSSKEQLEANKKNIERAERGYEIAKIRYDEGIGSLLELNDADLAFRTAKMNNLRTKFELLISYAQLDKMLGKFSENYQAINN